MLGLFLLSEKRDWPALAVGGVAGSIVSELISGHAVGHAIAVSLANSTESVVAAWLLSRRLNPPVALSNLNALVQFCVRAVILSNAVTACIGAAVLTHWLHASYLETWLLWWAGDGLGMLVVAPALLVWRGSAAWWRRARLRVVEAVVLLTALVVIGRMSLGPSLHWPLQPLPYMTFPLLFWAALRFGPPGAVTASLILATIATWNAGLGVGPLASPESSVIGTMTQLYMYLAVASLSSLIPAVILQERREAGEQRVESENRYHGVVNAATDAIITIGEDSRIEFANPAVEHVFGYAPDQLIGRELTMLMPVALRDQHRAGFARYLATGHKRIPWRAIALPGLHRDGHEIPIEISFGELTIQGRHLYTGIIRDMSEKRALEEQYRQSQKMEAVGQLAGGVAHDFNNLLTVIHGYGAIVRDDLGPDSVHHEDLQELLRAAERAESLTRQLLVFARKEIVAPRVIDLSTSVKRLETMLRRLIGEQIQLTVQAPPGAGLVKADPGQIEQVILNLVLNARDAMPDGGTLVLEVANAESADANHESSRDSPRALRRQVTLAVRDSGVGMDATTVSRAFEPFFTTKPQGKGTGLGLATVHGIVEQSGGSIAVQSELGRGSSFTVFLPQVDAEVEDAEASQSLDIGRRSETILVVDDDDALRKLTRRVLENNGFRVLAAATPGEALAIVDSHSEPIHLLLTDVVLPEMNGRVLAEAVVARRRDVRVLYMSGYTDDAVMKRGVLEREMQFLQKPFESHALLQKVVETLV